MRVLRGLRDAGFECISECFAYGLEVDAVKFKQLGSHQGTYRLWSVGSLPSGPTRNAVWLTAASRVWLSGSVTRSLFGVGMETRSVFSAST